LERSLNNKQPNQTISSIDALTVVGALVALCLVSIPVVGRQLDAKNRELAKNEAAFLAERLGGIDQEMGSRPVGDRSVASEASGLGKEIRAYAERLDPWGRAYHVEVIKNSYGQIVAIAIWSDGPDAHNDTDIAALHSAVLDGGVSFGGDDVGAVFNRP
jgi:hypothetical protein